MSFLQVMTGMVYLRQILGDELRKLLKLIVRVVLQPSDKRNVSQRRDTCHLISNILSS